MASLKDDSGYKQNKETHIDCGIRGRVELIYKLGTTATISIATGELVFNEAASLKWM